MPHRSRSRSPSYRSEDRRSKRRHSRSRSRSPTHSRNSKRHDRHEDNRSGSSHHRQEDRHVRRRTRSPTPSSEEDRHRRRRKHRDHRKERSPSDSEDEYKKRKSKKKKKERRERDKEKERREEEEELERQRLSNAFGYTDKDNPFNDENLGQKFVWVKKKQRDAKLGITPEEAARREKLRKEEAISELDKLNRRRAEREQERIAAEEERRRKQMEAELASMGDWHAREGDFHLEQAKRRAEIRIRENRAKPIDILAMNIRLAYEADAVEDPDLEVDLEEPYTIFDGLSVEEVEELHQDILMYLDLEKSPESLEFWRALIVVADDKLGKMKADARRIAEGGIAEPVNEDIEGLLRGKSFEELTVMQGQIQRKLMGDEPVDIEFWEHLLKSLTVWKARAKLKALHEDLLAKRLDQLRTRQREEALKVQEELTMAILDEEPQHAQADNGAEEDASSKQNLEEIQIEEYDRSMSPEPMERLPRDDRELPVITPEEDMKQLREKRREILQNQYYALKQKAIKKKLDQPEGATEEPEISYDQIMYAREAAQDFEEDEEFFNVEAAIQNQTYMWQDKYRPRKPRYFNRVHTGYEWNKYNQTHYDSESNPPPKTVQGYKFNIFYPDLIDKSKAPTYRIEKDPTSDETVILRFIAGPPYEDVAFRIIKREWEYSHKKGFRSSFDRGVLQLWFRFKRQFYRK
ncbi:uncharacterized protein VTP21DRAFT_445 [Calcarisporiella thermophila]|uniref:uncharacterized protein n=1 Tax=Calcarisporiella thermophila TaxID=911321 RepID=UPI00374386F5